MFQPVKLTRVNNKTVFPTNITHAVTSVGEGENGVALCLYSQSTFSVRKPHMPVSPSLIKSEQFDKNDNVMWPVGFCVPCGGPMVRVQE